jgi:hypothetical protein
MTCASAEPMEREEEEEEEAEVKNAAKTRKPRREWRK